MDRMPRCIGILAGGGSLPREIAACVAARGIPVEIVALEGEADADFAPFPVTWVNWGQVGRILRALKAAEADALVIVGRVKRPDLFRLRPDAGFFLGLARILGIYRLGGDDSVLRAVVSFFESKGIRVIGVADAAPEIVIGEGPLGTVRPNEAALRDIALGFEAVRALGPHDIGQGVVVTNGRIEAVEAAEGTDGMLQRLARQRTQKATTRSGVLVKRPKPGQELRVDLPAIGPDTARGAAAAGLAGIAVQAGRVIAAERPALIAAADGTGLFVAGLSDTVPPVDSAVRARSALAIKQLGKWRPSRRAEQDCTRGLEVLHSLEAFDTGCAVVVARGHVLAVETGEGAAAMLERSSGLRQWGAKRWGRRAGVVVVKPDTKLEPDLIRKAAEQGLEALAIASRESPHVAPACLVEADRLGLALLHASTPVEHSR